MRFGSLFSGIGGFDLGLERAGMECAWQVEIDSKAREVLRRHWPDVPCYEDITQIRGCDLEAVDLVCGGFPCQDLSAAGRREGLAGERSGLFYEFLRLAREIAPRWVLIENVPGLLSSNGGRDMGAVLGELGDLGYGWSYRILDSQYFGVAQRRRRVFIVGCAGGVCPPEVLFEPESLPGDSPPRREARAGAARSLTGGSDGHLAGRDMETEGALIIEGDSAASTPDLPRLRAGCGRAGEAAVVAHTPRSEGHDASEDGPGRGVPIVVPFVADPIVAKEGATWSHEGSNNFRLRNVVGAIPRRLTPRECERLQAFPEIRETAIIYACHSSENPQSDAPVAIPNHRLPNSVWSAGEGGVQLPAEFVESSSRTSQADPEQRVAVSVLIDSEAGRVDVLTAGRLLWSVSFVEPADSFPLPIRIEDFVRLSVLGLRRLEAATHDGKEGSPPSRDLSSPLRNGAVFAAVPGREIAGLASDAGMFTTEAKRLTKSITSVAGGSSPSSEPTWQTLCCYVAHAISGFIPEETRAASSYAFALTLVSGWTRYDSGGAEIADSPRYRMLGNAVTVSVAEWIGRRIVRAAT